MCSSCCDCMTSFFGAPFRGRSYAILLYLFLAPFIAVLGMGFVSSLLLPGVATVIVFGLGLALLLLLWYALRMLNWMDVYLGNHLLAKCDMEPRLTSDGTRGHGDCGCIHRVFSWPHARAILYFGLLKSIAASVSAAIAFGLLALSLGMMSHEGLVWLDRDLFLTKFEAEVQRLTPGVHVTGFLEYIRTPLGRSVEAFAGLVLFFISFQVVVALGALNRGLLELVGKQDKRPKHDVLLKHFDDDGGGFGYTHFGRGSTYSSRGSLNSSGSEVTVRAGGRGVHAVGASYADSLYSSIMTNRSGAEVYDSRATDYAYRPTDRRGYR